MQNIILMSFKYIFFYAILLLLNIDVTASQIDNPVLSYVKVKETNQFGVVEDSVLSAKLYFQELPEYGKETIVLLEYYSNFDTQEGYLVREQGISSTLNRSILLDHYTAFRQGPWKIGDTIKAEFKIKPIKVGPIEIVFFIIDKDFPRFRGDFIRAYIELGTNGKTISISHTEKKYIAHEPTGLFGPKKELFSRHLYFDFYPLLDDPYYEEFLNEERKSFIAKYYPFSLNTEFVPDETLQNLFHVKCTARSLHDFENGVAIEVAHSKLITVNNLSECFEKAVKIDDKCNFTFDFLVEKPGVAALAIYISSPNTALVKSKNIIHSNREKLSSAIVLYIGINPNNVIEFIVDKHPSALKKYSGTPPDSRLTLIKNYHADRELQHNYGKFYNSIYESE